MAKPDSCGCMCQVQQGDLLLTILDQIWSQISERCIQCDIESHELLNLKLEWTFLVVFQRPEARGREGGEVNQSWRQGRPYKFHNLQPGGDTNGGGSNVIARATPLTSIITNALL